MATMPTFDTGHVVTASEWNAHANQINTNTGDISGIDSRLTTAEGDISSNDSDISNIDARVTTLESSGGGGTAVTTQADDTTLYGDIISNQQRAQSWHAEPASNGYLTAAATIATKTFTATELRIAVLTAGASTSGGVVTFDLKFYTGPDVQNLTEQGFWFGDEHVTSTGMKTLALSDVAINAGDAIGISLIVTEAETSPAMASTPSSGSTSILVNPGTSVYSAYESGQTYPLPDSIDMTASSWTRGDKQFWFALA